jgi:hypothetical protein
MAVGDETIGYGATLEIDDGVGDAYAVVDKIVTLGVASYVTGVVESKRLDLTNRVIIKLPTLVNGGNFQFTVQFTHATYARLVAVRDLLAAKNFRFTIPDDDGDTVYTVPGILTETKVEDLDAEKITVISCTVEVSGDDT